LKDIYILWSNVGQQTLTRRAMGCTVVLRTSRCGVYTSSMQIHGNNSIQRLVV